MSPKHCFPRAFRACILVFVLVAGAVAAPSPAYPDASPSDGWIVSIGDSAISGEAGRWAGNTETDVSNVDALGASAYFDNATHGAEQIHGCHRSGAAEVHISGGVSSLNLACSGAHTYTVKKKGKDFKPGLDFYSSTDGEKSQLVMLREFASTHSVKAIAVLIGSNNYRFSDIVRTCVLDWYFSGAWAQRNCQDDPSMKANFSPANVDVQTQLVAGALRDISRTMTQAGYSADSYTIMAQTYSSPIPPASKFRNVERGYSRALAGCAIWDADADWVQTTVVPTFNNTIKNAVVKSGLDNVKILDAQDALAGHRLCEKGVGELEEVNIASWKSPLASERTEWVQQVRTVTNLFGPYQLQEDGHPSYWGQLALRNCLRQAYNNGAPKSGTCTSGKGDNSRGEPNMIFR
ncbi:hypothetical protein ACFWC5_39430 [Streptomyces sp. NPDC060085]|uniref:hypothetical protein n=1 Tax=Streptomyces sp. NPDC060085 TaxID=3347054 RepID=UPI0036527BCF